MLDWSNIKFCSIGAQWICDYDECNRQYGGAWDATEIPPGVNIPGCPSYYCQPRNQGIVPCKAYPAFTQNKMLVALSHT